MTKKKANIVIKVTEDESVEKAVRKFKRLCDKAGIRKQLKERRYYVSPGEKKRIKKRKAQRERMKNKNTEYSQPLRKYKSKDWSFHFPLDE